MCHVKVFFSEQKIMPMYIFTMIYPQHAIQYNNSLYTKTCLGYKDKIH